MADKSLSLEEATANFHDNGDGTFSLEVWPRSGATFRTTAGGLAPGQSLKSYVARIALTGAIQTLALWTVTTGKTCFFTDIFVDTDNATFIDVQLQAAAITIFRKNIRDLVPCNAPGIETQPQASSAQAVTLVLPAGAGNIDINIYAIEQ